MVRKMTCEFAGEAARLLGRRGGGVQDYGEGRSAAEIGSDPQLAAMAGDDMLHDCEAKPGSGFLAALVIRPVEALGEPGQMRLGNALAVIADREQQLAPVGAGTVFD